MIDEFEFYHGAAIVRAIHEAGRPIQIALRAGGSNGAYVIDGRVGLYMKHSGKRMSPWRFTFAPEHFSELENLTAMYREVLVALICGEDGIVCLSKEELSQVSGHSTTNARWVSIERRPRSMYRVRGSEGELARRLGMRTLADKLKLSRVG